MYFIIGARGQLGKTFHRLLLKEQVDPLLLDRAIYQDWWHPKAADSISKFFEKFSYSQKTPPVILNAAGLVNPVHNRQDHLNVNFLLAKHLVEGGTRIGCKVVTIGTIMEKILSKNPSNSYVFAKNRLNEFLNSFSKSNEFLHVRIHTLYGIGLPHPFMFLGQIFNSLLKRTSFNMTPGNQLREYHHVEDDAKAILELIKMKQRGAFDLNHGEPITLRELAYFIFDNFNSLDLLKIASLPVPEKENYDLLFKRSSSLSGFNFRRSLPAIVDYIRLCLLNKKDLK